MLIFYAGWTIVTTLAPSGASANAIMRKASDILKHDPEVRGVVRHRCLSCCCGCCSAHAAGFAAYALPPPSLVTRSLTGHPPSPARTSVLRSCSL